MDVGFRALVSKAPWCGAAVIIVAFWTELADVIVWAIADLV